MIKALDFNSVPPPHLSPFVDNEAEGHVPEYAAAIELLKAAARKDVLPLPGMGRDAEGDTGPDSKQIAEDNASMSTIAMSRSKRELYEAMQMGRERRRAHVGLLKERKKKIDEAKKKKKSA